MLKSVRSFSVFTGLVADGRILLSTVLIEQQSVVYHSLYGEGCIYSLKLKRKERIIRPGEKIIRASATTFTNLSFFYLACSQQSLLSTLFFLAARDNHLSVILSHLLMLTLMLSLSFRRLLANGSLFFSTVYHTRVQRPDEGVYQCVAEAEGVGSMVSRTARLTVEGNT